MREILTGYHAIEERLKEGSIEGTLYVARENSRIARLLGDARKTGIPIRRENMQALDRLCGHADHRGAVLVVTGTTAERRAPSLESVLSGLPEGRGLVLVLCGITDPHNLGAILRSADQFRVDLVVLPERRSARDSEIIARTSAGAAAYVPLIVVPNLVRSLAVLKDAGFWIYGADVAGEPVDRTTLSGRTALVLGSEGSGLPRLATEQCDALVRIPAEGHLDSFNVSVAAGILLYEVRRQQGFFRNGE